MKQQNSNEQQDKPQQGSGRTITNNNKQDNRQFSNSSTNDQNANVEAGQNSNKATGDNTIKNPDNWTTGDEPMTGAQGSYLNTLASEAGEELDKDLTKAEASKKIDELQHKTGRGLQGTDDSA